MLPNEGGSYTRDPKTGDLKRVEDPTTIQDHPPVEPTGVEPDLDPTNEGETPGATPRGKRS